MKIGANYFSKILFLFDFFGKPFCLYIKDDRHEFNTKTGGIYSLLVLVSTGIFGIIRLIEWKEGKLPQSIVSYGQANENVLQAEMPHNLINIRIYGKDIIPNEFYFVPILQQWIGEEIQSKAYILQTNNCSEPNSYCLSEKDEKLFKFVSNQVALNNSDNIDYSIYFYQCNKELLKENQKCSSEENIQEVISAKIYISIKIRLSQYNNQKRKLMQYDKEYYFYLDKTYYQIANIQLKMKDLKVLNGYPMAKPVKYNFLHDSNIFIENINSNFSVNLSGLKQIAYMEIYLTLDENYQVEKIEEYNFIDLLLIIYNFFRFLYSFGYILSIRAEYLLQQKMSSKLFCKNEDHQANKKNYIQLNNVLNLLQLLNRFHQAEEKKKKKNNEIQLENIQKKDKIKVQSQPIFSINLEDENPYFWDDNEIEEKKSGIDYYNYMKNEQLY